MDQMVRPMLEPQLEIVQGPPRGLVAMACHEDAIKYCRRYCSCWKGMTSCLARHRQDIAPRCENLLQLSGILKEKSPEQPKKHEGFSAGTVDDESKAGFSVERSSKGTKTGISVRSIAPKAPSPLKLPPIPLSLQSSLQQIHNSITKDRVGMEKTQKSLRGNHKHKGKKVATTKHLRAPVASSTTTAHASGASSTSMSEGTPAYLTGDMEKPLGKDKDMGGWKMRTYSREQQAHLQTDETGEPLSKPHNHSIAAKTSQFLKELQTWVQGMHPVYFGVLALFLLVCAMIAGICYRKNKRRQEELSGQYAHLIGHEDEMPLHTMGGGSVEQI